MTNKELNNFHPWKLAQELLALESGPKPLGEETDIQKADVQAIEAGMRRAVLSLHDLLLPDFSIHDGGSPKLDYHAALNNFILGYEENGEGWSPRGTEEGRSLYIHLHAHGFTTTQLREGEWPPPKDQKDLEDFVRDLVQNLIFTDKQIVSADMLGMVFLPIAMGALNDRSWNELMNVGLLYEYYNKAIPSRAINGCPMFFSVNLMNKADWARCAKAADAQIQLLKEIEV